MTGVRGQAGHGADARRACARRRRRRSAGWPVTAFEDLRDEKGRLGPLKGATDAAARNFLIFRLGERRRVVLRPSGTEPKAKTYVEANSPPCAPGTPAEAWQRTCREVDELVKRLGADFQRQALALIGKESGK